MHAKLESNSSEKGDFMCGNTAARYKLSDISLEQDAIFDKRYAITIDELYDGVSLTSYT